ncbi:DNA-dependent protein kinase catalytic subunit [Portunus trituberculatus]|uniref:DNA-dependent protein kinase catalytic subunit n=1 Tax=Portunus trituberculatus TaxID=210409 RepID=A0A5B7JU58_PORTR|nr:DNA-dependent protein kinase catalytic subunit [Portunus trituberculatus]
MWTLEILSHLMSALDLAQNDDPALGTHEQTRAAILHTSSNRRIPVDFEGGTFEDMLLWLLEQCGSPKTLVRHISMELLESLAPHSKVDSFAASLTLGLRSLSSIVEA